MEQVIEVSNLYKGFNGRNVLADVSLTLSKGQTLGLVGKNGAGKSTLIKIILGFLSPTSGSVRVFGRATTTNSGLIGYLPEHASYHMVFSGKEYLTLLGKMSSVTDVHKRVSEVLDLVGMTNDANRRMSRYSKGMLQRIGLAQAILLDPSLLILDEPLTGLDPSGQKDLRDIILELQRRNKSILLCSHLLNEVERLCTQIAIIHNTAIVARGNIKELLLSNNKYIIKAVGLSGTAALELQENFCLKKLSSGDYLFEEEYNGHKETLLRTMLDAGAAINQLTPVQKSLEEYFLLATGGSQ
ncbi:MAG TPA: ABC transporter ATP-binding protein [Candidatus Deferrimicrobium sp.]|nr:ABC transporter ATP-binding protein [Candidatus Deferrimicrobium sp.]